MRTILLAFVFMLLFADATLACSRRLGAPPSTVPSEVSAFIGTVVRYVPEEAVLAQTHGTSGVLVVRVSEALPPLRSGAEVEVQPRRVFSDCSFTGFEADEVRKKYPVGTKVAVVGWRNQLAGGILAEEIAWSGDGISSVPESYSSTRNGTLDFKKLYKPPGSRWGWSPFAQYQFYKSLSVLPSLSETGKISELENLQYYGRFHCLLPEIYRKSYIDIVRNTRLSPVVKQEILASMPDTTGLTDSEVSSEILKGTRFEGYCRVNE